jgi:hypothetical protein
MTDVTYGSGTEDDPWILKTPPLTSEFHVWKDVASDPPALMVQVGKTRLSYRLSALEDAHAMLKAHGDWMDLGNADEGKPTGTAVDSQTMSRRRWSCWASWSLNTTRATTGCARSDRLPGPRRGSAEMASGRAFGALLRAP